MWFPCLFLNWRDVRLVENMFRWLMDGLFDDSSKVGVLVRGFWVGELLVNIDVGPHL